MVAFCLSNFSLFVTKSLHKNLLGFQSRILDQRRIFQLVLCLSPGLIVELFSDTYPLKPIEIRLIYQITV